MNKRSLLLLVLAAVFTISCDEMRPGVVKITNNSEHNITWVVIIDTESGYAALSEIKNELIAKNGGSCTFDVYVGFRSSKKFIACVKAEDTSKLMCTAEFELFECFSENKVAKFVWNGNGDPAWQPQ